MSEKKEVRDLIQFGIAIIKKIWHAIMMFIPKPDQNQKPIINGNELEVFKERIQAFKDDLERRTKEHNSQIGSG